MTLLEQLATVATRHDALMTQVAAAIETADWARLETFKPLLEELATERERLEVAHYGAWRAARMKRERKCHSQVELVARLRGAIQAAVNESQWDALEKLAALIKVESRRLASMAAPRTLQLVGGTSS